VLEAGVNETSGQHPVAFSALTLLVGRKEEHTHTHTQPFNGLLSGTTWVGWYQKKHLPTRTSPSSSSIYNDPWHPLCSVYELDSPLGQPLSGSSSWRKEEHITCILVIRC